MSFFLLNKLIFFYQYLFDRTELCAFSQFKIYPGHGKRVVKADLRVSHFFCLFNKYSTFVLTLFFFVQFSKTVIFLNRKCEASFNFKRNPRKINWTVLYRRKHKKGQVIIQRFYVSLFIIIDICIYKRTILN